MWTNLKFVVPSKKNPDKGNCMCVIPLVQASIKCKLIYNDSNQIVVSLARGEKEGFHSGTRKFLGSWICSLS